MNAIHCLKMTLMTASRRKKTIVYGCFAAVIIFAVVQVTYFNGAYSPLQVLSDARSEARRLLRFMTLYHYQCNSTLQWTNASHWPVCVEKAAGLNLVLGGPRVMYSIGPVGDCTFERTLALNYSYNVHIFHHDSLNIDFMPVFKQNRTRVYKASIVPNDPADFGRNSYDTQTLNTIFESLNHKYIDILKIESLADTVHSHELLYYMIKDHLLTKVRQLHMALYIDKVDDDYLYSWYRALYMLFHNEGYRLFHSSASDPLCLQVTLMESCIYYMSWIRDPGPESFILYPPAIDGSASFEIERLLDYMEDTTAECDHDLEVTIPSASRISLCEDAISAASSKPCQLVILRSSSNDGSITAIPNSKCSVTTLEVESIQPGETTFTVKHRRYTRRTDGAVSILAALQDHLPSSSVNMVYVDMDGQFWPILTEILDSGALFNVDQLILNIKDLWGDRHAVNIRRKYSELKRVEAYGFRKYQINDLMSGSKLTFHSKLAADQEQYKMNYIKLRAGRVK